MFRRNFRHSATKCRVLIWITDIGTFRSKNDGARTEIQGTDPFCQGLGRTDSSAQAHYSFFIFPLFLAIYLHLLSIFFTRLRTHSYKSKGPDINLNTKDSRSEKRNACKTKIEVDALFLRLMRIDICAQVLFCTFLSHIQILVMKMIWMQDLFYS